MDKICVHTIIKIRFFFKIYEDMIFYNFFFTRNVIKSVGHIIIIILVLRIWNAIGNIASNNVYNW